MPRTSLGRARITALSIVIGGFNACDRSARAPDGVAGLPQNHGAPAGHPGADRRLGLLLEPGVDLLDVEPHEQEEDERVGRERQPHVLM